MVSQSRDAAIVGIHEYPSRDVEGKVNALQIKAASAAKALADAGLNWSDVDTIYDAGEGAPMSGLMISEYFGIQPTVMDTTGVGGSSYEFHTAHALRAIREGKAKVALLTYGSTAHSNAMAIGADVPGGGISPATIWRALLAKHSSLTMRWWLTDICTNTAPLANSWPKYPPPRYHAMRNPEAVRQ